MKYIIILGDGMSDRPTQALGGLTPLQAADTPNINKLARMGRTGMLKSVPDGWKPGSEIANLSILGYDVSKVFEGRGSLEAASMGIEIGDDEMAMRCNLITIKEGKIKNHSAGHITNSEANVLIAYLQKELGGTRVNFFPGISYRHLLKMKNGDKRIECTPPHDVPGTPFRNVMIKPQVPEAAETAEYLNMLTLRSQEILADHPVNQKRIAEGKDPANSIWLWSPGYRPKMDTLAQKYGLEKGSVISAVDLIKGIGRYAGLKSIEVEGATGLYDTNYEGKAAAAIEALRTDDFVFLHIEASDEAGHEGDAALKIRTIEYLDKRVVGPIMDELSKWDEPVTIAVLPDHPTPVELRIHVNDPVPFIIYKPGEEPDKITEYNEFEPQNGYYGTIEAADFMDILTGRK